MNPNAKPPKTINQTLATPLSQPLKTIALPKHIHKPTPVPKRLRNASVGMAISYSSNVGALAHPVFFLLRNLLPLMASFIHLFIPLALAWFASHWNANVEEAIWGGNALSVAASFASLWIIALLAWSLFWIASLAFFAKLAAIVENFADVGEDYLVSKKSQGQSRSKIDA